MKYDESACKFNMDTGCVELLLLDGRKISIDCTGVEDELDVTMAQGYFCVCSGRFYIFWMMPPSQRHRVSPA